MPQYLFKRPSTYYKIMEWKLRNSSYYRSKTGCLFSYRRLVLRFVGFWERAFRKARAERCSSFNWMLLLEPSVTNSSRMSWIWRSCRGIKGNVCYLRSTLQVNMQKEAYKPVLHSQPQLSGADGSPHPLGCGHVWAWPPALLALSRPWWAPPYMHSAHAQVSAIYDGCPQSLGPSEWTLRIAVNI